MSYFGSCRSEFVNAIVTFEISNLEFVKMQSFLLKKVWYQNFLLWVLLDWNLKKIFSYLKLATFTLSKCKISSNTKKL